MLLIQVEKTNKRSRKLARDDWVVFANFKSDINRSNIKNHTVTVLLTSTKLALTLAHSHNNTMATPACLRLHALSPWTGGETKGCRAALAETR